jgi:hypothetical protein
LGALKGHCLDEFEFSTGSPGHRDRACRYDSLRKRKEKREKQLRRVEDRRSEEVGGLFRFPTALIPK